MHAVRAFKTRYRPSGELCALLLLWLMSLFATPAFAVVYCVGTSTELNNALTAAAASNADDEILLETGTYTLGETDLAVRGELVIRGGQPQNCTGFGVLSTTSTIRTTSNLDFDLSSRFGDVVLERLIFSGWRQVRLDDTFSSAGAVGEFRVSRCRFNNQSRGLLVNNRRFDVRVENSIFTGYANDGLRIVSSTSGEPDMQVLVQFNTMVNPTGAVGTTAGLLLDSRNTAFATLEIYNNVIDGNPLDLRIFGQLATASFNLWNTQDFQLGGGLAQGSTGNRSGDPGLNGNPDFRPIVPTSQLINNGATTNANMPSRDYEGNTRLVGTRPDIGAYETTVDNSSTLTVSNTNNSGSGSLRTAITAANSNPELKKIVFDIPGGCPQQINLSTALPPLTEPVEIDGYSQPGSVLNQNTSSFNGTVCVFLVGSNNLATGLHLQTQALEDDMTVRGLGFYGFSSEALRIDGPGKGNVRGNVFATGLPLIGQSFADAVIRVQGAPGTVIGTSQAADKNVIGGGNVVGIDLLDNTAGARRVTGNLIGINRNGTTGLPNAIGIRVDNSSADRIERNIVSFNQSHAVVLGAGSNNAFVFNNDFGGGLGSGTSSGNGGNAVRVLGGSSHVLRSNAIRRGAGDGLVVLSTGRSVWMDRNTFDGNQAQAIDLSPDGVNPIDLDVGQTGANDQQNYPLITAASGSNSQGEVVLDFSSANGTYRIDLYANDDCFPSVGGFNQAKRLVGGASGIVLDCATTNSNCTREVRIPISNDTIDGDPLVGEGITSMATDEEGNSSEISACRLYQLGEQIFRNGFE